ncbi:DUF397 domain-containing protein [Streptomyces sp. NPDC021356]|uniref:DUF397 domain-containing protein n=1 Tax=Streptomyces sp. NPDC021356 TaxID=3154900 RepID=UPI0033FACF7E
MSTPELHWSKSGYSSSGEPGDCVEVAATPAAVHVRDSKRPESARLAVAPASWADFVAYVGE